VPEEITYPLEFNKCPACGCEDTVSKKVAEEEIEKGRMKEGYTPALTQDTTPIFDPREVIIFQRRVPVLITFYDVCVACGCYYCVRIEKGEGMVTPQMQRPPIGKH